MSLEKNELRIHQAENARKDYQRKLIAALRKNYERNIAKLEKKIADRGLTEEEQADLKKFQESLKLLTAS